MEEIVDVIFKRFKLITTIKHIKRHHNAAIPFFIGLIIGIAITALMFQQNYLYLQNNIGVILIAKRDQILKENVNTKMTEVPVPQIIEIKVPVHTDHHTSQSTGHVLEKNAYDFTRKKKLQNELQMRKKIYAGVITAEKYLATRATGVNNTWGSQVDKIEFFSEHGRSEEFDIPIVNLDGISDKEYPPQKKAFKMLMHMCKSIDDFEWFIRSDDDVYIRVEKLLLLLNKIDSNQMIYMGQTGHGLPEVRDRLGLKGRNFCMGGPGVIFSRSALKALCPHLSKCLQEVVSGEEDVEIGRCVSNHIGIECTHAWDNLKHFYHSYEEEYTEEKPFLGNLAENKHVEMAVTLHHVKVPYIMYRIHRFFANQKLNCTQQNISHLKAKLQYVNLHLPKSNRHQMIFKKEDTGVSKSFSRSNYWMSFDLESIFGLSTSVVVHDIRNQYLADLKQICETAIDIAVGQVSSDMAFSYFSGGYIRSNPLYGTEYILDVTFTDKKDENLNQIKRIQLLRPLHQPSIQNVFKINEMEPKHESVPVYIIIPLEIHQSSKLEFFLSKYFEPLVEKFNIQKTSYYQIVVIVSVLENSENFEKPPHDSSHSIYDVINWYRIKLPTLRIEVADMGEVNKGGSNLVKLDRAFTKALERTKSLAGRNLNKSVVIFSLINRTVSERFLSICSSYLLNEKINGSFSPMILQAIPFQIFSTTPVSFYTDDSSVSHKKLDKNFIFNNAQNNVGFWNIFQDSEESDASSNPYFDMKFPMCGSLSNILQLSQKLSKGKLVISNILQEVYFNRVTALRYPDGELIDLPGH